MLGVLLLAACDQGGSADEAPPAEFTASFTREPYALTIDYTLRNTGDDPLVVYNGVVGEGGFGPPTADAVYITPGADGTVQIAKRVFDAPAGVDPQARALIRGEIVPPGGKVAERVRVALPLTPSHPYGSDQAGRLPDPARRVMFCVGAASQREFPERLRNGIPRPGQSPTPSPGRYGDFTHPSPQHLYCSEVYDLGS